MSSAEFSEWQAFQRLDGPLGLRREDWHATLVACMVANGNRDPRRHRRAYQPDDFLPDWAEASGWRKALPDPQDVADKVKGLFNQLVRRGREREARR